MPTLLPLVLLLHLVIPASGSDFFSSATSAVGSAARSAASATEKAAGSVADASGQAAGAVSGASEEAARHLAGAVTDASQKAALVAADAAIKQSGKCDSLHRDAHKIGPVASPLIARGLQESADDPSSDASTCRKVVLDTIVAELDKTWHDATGLVGSLVAGLSGSVLSHICGSALMKSLKFQEGMRKSDPSWYKTHIQQTLHESVLTDAWVGDAITAHCGSASVARLFTVSSEQQSGPLGYTSWSALASAACLSAASFSVALLGVLLASARRQRRTPAPLLDGSSFAEGYVCGTEAGAEAVE